MTELIEEQKEFNQMDLYHKRIHEICQRRDQAFSDGDTSRFYRELRSLLSNAEFKMTKEKIIFTELKEKIVGAKQKVISLAGSTNTQQYETNKIQAEDDLIELSAELNKLIDDAGIIYPIKKPFDLKEKLKEDYG